MKRTENKNLKAWDCRAGTESPWGRHCHRAWPAYKEDPQAIDLSVSYVCKAWFIRQVSEQQEGDEEISISGGNRKKSGLLQGAVSVTGKMNSAREKQCKLLSSEAGSPGWEPS